MGLSADFVVEKAAHRTAGLQAEVANRPHLALCVLVLVLVDRAGTLAVQRSDNRAVAQDPLPEYR